MRFIAILTASLGLAACQVTPMAEAEPKDCGSSEMTHLIGIGRTQLESIAFSQPYRILGEDDAKTMDFQAERVNFILDDSGTVARIECG
jgi:hypothetical protein